MGYPIPKYVPWPAIVKPPDPNSNVFYSTNSIRTSWQPKILPQQFIFDNELPLSSSTTPVNMVEVKSGPPKYFYKQHISVYFKAQKSMFSSINESNEKK